MRALLICILLTCAIATAHAQQPKLLPREEDPLRMSLSKEDFERHRAAKEKFISMTPAEQRKLMDRQYLSMPGLTPEQRKAYKAARREEERKIAEEAERMEKERKRAEKGTEKKRQQQKETHAQ